MHCSFGCFQVGRPVDAAVAGDLQIPGLQRLLERYGPLAQVHVPLMQNRFNSRAVELQKPNQPAAQAWITASTAQ
jgi:hypothetical protein